MDPAKRDRNSCSAGRTWVCQVLAPLLLLFSAALAAGSPDLDFWQWFVTNDARIFEAKTADDPILDQLAAHLHQINPDLTYQIGSVRDGKREFVISANGIRSAFPFVEALYANAPASGHWNWAKYRQRLKRLLAIKLNNISVSPGDVSFVATEEDGKFTVVLYIKGLTERSRSDYEQIAYLFLDQALGEFDVETGVGSIEIRKADGAGFAMSKPLGQLAGDFDRYRALQAKRS